MAETLAALGGLSAVLQIADGMAKTISRISSCIDTMRKAPRQVQDFEIQSVNFSNNLHMFYDLSEECIARMHPTSSKTGTRLLQAAGMILQSRRVMTGMEDLLKRLENLLGYEGGSVFRKWRERILWVFDQSLVKHLRLDLSVVSTTMGNFISMLMWEDLARRLENSSSKEVKAKINRQMFSIKRQLDTQIVVAKAYRDELQEFEREHYPDLESSEEHRLIAVSAMELERSLKHKLRKSNLRPNTTSPTFTFPSSEASRSQQELYDCQHASNVTMRTRTSSSGAGSAGPHANLFDHGPPSSRVSPIPYSRNIEQEDEVSDPSAELDNLSDPSKLEGEDVLALPEVDQPHGTTTRTSIYGPRIRDDGTNLECFEGEWPDRVQDLGEAGSDFRGETNSIINQAEDNVAGSGHRRSKGRDKKRIDTLENGNRRAPRGQSRERYRETARNEINLHTEQNKNGVSTNGDRKNRKDEKNIIKKQNVDEAKGNRTKEDRTVFGDQTKTIISNGRRNELETVAKTDQ